MLSDYRDADRCAFEGKYEVTAVSFHALRASARQVSIAAAWCEPGRQYGVPSWSPCATSRRGRDAATARPPHWHHRENSTACLPHPPDVRSGFRAGNPAVRRNSARGADGKVDAGLLIHPEGSSRMRRRVEEGRRPGRVWFERTGGLPLPLGQRDSPRPGPELMAKVSTMLHHSIAHALTTAKPPRYAQQFGRGLDRADTDTFVGMY